jgi:hypothetical protein
VTANQLLYDAKSLLGNRESLKPNDAEGIRFINYSIYTLSNLLDGLYRTWETASTTLTRERATAMSYDGLNVSTHTYTYTTKILTSIAAHGLTSTSVGGIVGIWDAGTSKTYCGIIESIPSATTIKLAEDPVGANIAALRYAVVTSPWYTDGENISSLNIKSILAVKDATNGDVLRLNGREFESFEDNPNLESSVGMWDFGDGIHLKLGADVWDVDFVLRLRPDRDHGGHRLC